MGAFVSGQVAITVAGVTDEKDITPQTDVIYIRTKMDFGTRQRVLGSAVKVTQKLSGNRRERRRQRATGQGGDQDAEFNVGMYQMALLTHNILGWNGPSFAGRACTVANIEQLDPDWPLAKRVLEEIAERNTTEDDEQDDDDPNSIIIDMETPATSLVPMS